MKVLLCAIWNIPDGFATLVGGIFVLVAALIAWLSVQRQIKSAEKIEQKRVATEASALEDGFRSELIVFSRYVIDAASDWNNRAARHPRDEVSGGWPLFMEPLYYRTNIAKIGLMRKPSVASALIALYAHMLDLNDLSKETMLGHRTANVTNDRIAWQLRVMAMSMASALDGLLDGKGIPLVDNYRLESVIMPDGRPIVAAPPIPKYLQEVLRSVATGPGKTK